jgi:predicted small secreted protein
LQGGVPMMRIRLYQLAMLVAFAVVLAGCGNKY